MQLTSLPLTSVIDWFDLWCLNATFSNISTISCQPVLVVEVAGSTWREPPTMGKLYHLRLRLECTLFSNLQSRTWTHAVLLIGLYELLGNPTTKLIEPPGPFLQVWVLPPGEYLYFIKLLLLSVLFFLSFWGGCLPNKIYLYILLTHITFSNCAIYILKYSRTILYVRI